MNKNGRQLALCKTLYYTISIKSGEFNGLNLLISMYLPILFLLYYVTPKIYLFNGNSYTYLKKKYKYFIG